MKTFPKVAVMLLVALVCSSAVRAAGVLDQVPPDAWVVVKVNNLQQTSDKVAKWAEQLGLAQMVPQFADPVGTLEKELKITNGLDKSGEMAFVMLDPDLGNGEPDQTLLILLPTKDFKAMTGNFKNFKAGAAGAPGSFKDENGKDIFISQWGGYAVFSPSSKMISKKPAAALKLNGVVAKELAEKDITMFANIPAMKAKTLPKLKEARQKAMDEVDRGGAGAFGPPRVAAPASKVGNVILTAADDDDEPAPAAPKKGAAGAKAPAATGAKAPAGAGAKKPAAGDAATDAEKFKPVGKAVVTLMFNAAERFMNESTGATFSIHLTDEGLNTSLMADFVKDSYMGKFASGLKNTDADLLKGLPARKYFAFGGAAWNSDAMNMVVGDMLDPISKALAETNADGSKDVVGFVDNVKKAMSAMKSVTVGYTVPTGALGADSIVQAIQVIHGDSKVIAETQKKNWDFTSKMLAGMPQNAGIKTDLEIKEGAKTVSGVKMDMFKMNMEMDENNPQAAQAQQAMAFIYGPNGLSGYMGTIDPNTYLIVTGGTDKLLADAIAGAKAQQDVFSKMENVQAVSKQLPANKVMVQYIDLAQIITSGVKYAQSFNVPVKLQLPANLPPIGVAAATDGTALRLDSHIPTSLVQSVVAAGMQTFMQMNGGGPGNAGNPDGL